MTEIHRDWKEFLLALRSENTTFLLIGAHALAFHVEARLTNDLDVFVEPSTENAARVHRALDAFGFGGLIADILTASTGVTFRRADPRWSRIRPMRAIALVLPLVLAAGCGDFSEPGEPDDGVADDGDDAADDAPDDGDDGATDDGATDDGAAPGEMSHEFEPIAVEAGTEVTSMCVSWSLGNTEPLFVDTVAMEAGPGWHHSNWFYVPAGTFSVDDGNWDCGDEFDQIQAALAGGVLFAQSTQATAETQRFADGAALELPPNSVVVSQIHLVNAADVDIDTGVTMTLGSVDEADVAIRLRPLSFDFHQLAIPPNQRSRFETSCDLEEAIGEALDISLYYVLPHYHSYAEGMDISFSGGERDGEEIYQIESGIGEPLGSTLTPPLSMSQSRGIRFSCTYDNSSDRTIGYGNNQNDEMCIFLAFTDSELSFGGGVLSGEPVLRGIEDGVAVYEGGCTVFGL